MMATGHFFPWCCLLCEQGGINFFFLSLKSSNIVGDHYNDCQTIQEFFSSRTVHCDPVNEIPEILKCDHSEVREVSVSPYKTKFGYSLLFS